MSFTRFIYYCALCGAWAAFIGWILGRSLPLGDEHKYLQQGMKALLLGMTVALALGIVDAIWNVPLNQYATIGLRGLTAVVIASIGAFFSGIIGEFFRNLTENIPILGALFWILGWTITGLLIGASLGAFETALSMARKQNVRGALRKTINGVLGGAVGGFLGGALSLAMRFIWMKLLTGKSESVLLSPSAWGFVVLGLCIGLLIGLAQVILKEAWLKVESGFGAGRELMLTKDETTIGRAESCDIGLFGDTAIEKLHVRIRRADNRYVLVDADSAAGTYLNDQRVTTPVALNAGDSIRVGKSVLTFGERQKRTTD